ncbi:MAG: hypothetical protein ACI9D5_000814 [Candidatus Endobugula sp.]|jgi:hypothetical protein
MKYPFSPKSTSYLEPGQFWAIPLSNGEYGCGIVVAKLASLHDHSKIETRLFLAALINWHGEQLPIPEEIQNLEILEVGAAHVKTILTTGGVVLGKAKFRGLGNNPRVKTDEINTFGYSVLKVVAEKRFVKNS